jgi:signal transduction histidine kinase
MFCAYGQHNATIDSLKTVLKTAKPDTAKVNSLNALSSEYRKIEEFEMSFQYAELALELARTLVHNNGILESYTNTVQACLRMECPDFLKILFTYLKIFEEIGDKKGMSRCYMNIGNIYGGMGNSPQALKYYLTSLNISEKMGYKTVMAGSYINIGGIYQGQENHQAALENYISALKIFEEIGAKKGIASCYNGIGTVYSKMGQMDKALENYLASLKIKEEIGFKIGMANSYNNIGEIYQEQGNYREALKNHFTALKIREEIGHRNGIAGSNNNIGEIYLDQDNYTEARKYLEEGLFVAKKIKRKARIRNSYQSLSKLDSAEGNFRQALEHHKMFTIYKDSLLNEESKKQTDQLLVLYEAEKKDREIELLTKDKALQEQQLEKQKLLRNVMVAGVLLIALVGLLAFRSFRLRKKLEKQWAIVKERHRISADLHDDIGSGLSKITLLSELLKTQAKTPENRKEAEKISETALELSSTLSEIIWALNSNNDYLENMVAYIRRYAVEYFDDSPVKLRVISQGNILPIPINGEHRRNIFYTVKEALNNILKHAEATEAELKFVVVNDKLDVIISDNGKGIPKANMNRFGNGIKNMRARMKMISGEFKIESDHGTRIILKSAI